MNRKAKSKVIIWRPFASPEHRPLRPISDVIADTVEKSAKLAGVAIVGAKRKAKTKIHRVA